MSSEKCSVPFKNPPFYQWSGFQGLFRKRPDGHDPSKTVLDSLANYLKEVPVDAQLTSGKRYEVRWSNIDYLLNEVRAM